MELCLKNYTIFIKKRQIKSLGFMSPPLPQETQSTESKYQGEILHAAQSLYSNSGLRNPISRNEFQREN